jgi:arabinofuranosyltransferase
MSDDALITLRSSLNWDHGLGPQYNATERVVGYTHPLWFLILTITGMITASWIFGTLYLSIALAATAATVIVLRARNNWQLTLVGAFLLLSNTVTDWSTSGLENPLSAALLAGFFASMTRDGHVRRPMLTGALAALLLLCRLDYLILLAPWLLATTWSMRARRAHLLRLITGLATPIAVWALVTITYYHFLLPSTFAAKTNSLIPRTELIGRGVDYVRLSLGYDPAMAVLFASVILLAIIARERPLIIWSTGTVIYLAYVVWVGGDYMLGRFLHIPALALLLAVTQTQLPRSARYSEAADRLLYAIPIAAVVIAGPFSLMLKTSPTESTTQAVIAPIGDERPGWVALGRGLDPLGSQQNNPGIIPTDLHFLDRQADSWPTDVPIGAQPEGSVLVRCGGLGAVGFLLPSTYVIDSCGLTDRFMASQVFVPPTDGSVWKAGHFIREEPRGYSLAVERNDPSYVEDPELRRELAELWKSIRPTQG